MSEEQRLKAVPAEVLAASTAWKAKAKPDALMELLGCPSKHRALGLIVKYRDLYGKQLFPYRKQAVAQGGYSKAKLDKLSALWKSGCTSAEFEKVAKINKGSAWGDAASPSRKTWRCHVPQKRLKVTGGKMFFGLLISGMLTFAGSHNCSGAVDKFTGLTKCELRELDRQIKVETQRNPIPSEVRVIDSTLKALSARKHALLLDYKFKAVSTVCYRNKLSVSNRVVNDTFFVCIDEGL